MFISILEQSLMALPMICGAYLLLSLLKLPDFSIESSYLCGAVAAFLAKDLPLPLMLLATMGGGVIVASLVCVLNKLFSIPYLLAAIIVNGFCHGLIQYVLGGSMVRFMPTLDFGEMELLVAVAVVLLIFMTFLLRSQLGYSLAVYGHNAKFFQHHGISDQYVFFAGVILGHSLIALSGFLFARANGFVELSMQIGIILLCLTTLMIGKLAMGRQLPNIGVPLIGIIAYFTLQQLLLRMGLDLRYFNAIQAIAVLGLLIAGRKKLVLTVDHLGV